MLLAHDRPNEARTILRRLQKSAYSTFEDNIIINAELQEIEHALEEEREATKGKTSSLSSRIAHSGSAAVRSLVQFMQQLSGINLITYVSLP